VEGEDLEKAVDLLFNARRVWLVGNGGSASNASHFYSDLDSLGFDCKCLVNNSSRITALLNDKPKEQLYVEQMTRFVPDDLLVVFSVHGGKGQDEAGTWSQNLVRACQYAEQVNGKILAFLGSDGGYIKNYSDISLIVPHESAYLVEGIHSVLTHLICKRLRENEPNIS